MPETALDCLVVDEGGQRLIFNCYDLPEGLTYAYDDPDQPLHQYVLVTDQEGNVLLREDGCTAQSLASYRGSFADWLTLSWFRGADWGIAREGLYNILTGQLLTGEDDSSASACGVGIACLQSRQDSRSILYDLNSDEAVELGRFDWCVMDHTPGCVTLLGSDDPDNPYTLIDLASGEKTAVQRRDRDYHSGNVAVLTADNVLKVYDGTTGALLTDVEVTPIEEACHVSVTALPGGYALLQYDDEDYNTLAIQTYGGEGLLWSSADETEQYTYVSYLTNTANGPLLTAHRDNSDSSDLSDVLDMEGNVLLRRLGSCYSTGRPARRLLYRAAGLRLRPDGLHRPVALPRKYLFLPRRRLRRRLSVLTTEVFGYEREDFPPQLPAGAGPRLSGRQCSPPAPPALADSPADSPAASVPDADTAPVPFLSVEEFPRLDGSTACIPLMAQLKADVTGMDLLEAQTGITVSTTAYAWENFGLWSRSASEDYGAQLLIVYEAPEYVKEELAEADAKLEQKAIGRDALVFIVNEVQPRPEPDPAAAAGHLCGPHHQLEGGGRRRRPHRGLPARAWTRAVRPSSKSCSSTRATAS